MIIDSPDTKRTQNQSREDAEDNDNHLLLNPGPSERKARSIGTPCLWFTILLIVLVGGTTAYFFISKVVYQFQHPHHDLYYQPPAEGGELDLSAAVQPMIKEGDLFDVVASVWIRDDGGKDGTIFMDGEERPERLIFSDTVFRNVRINGKQEFANVALRIPMSHL
jgi:hypothetical protein